MINYRTPSKRLLQYKSIGKKLPISRSPFPLKSADGSIDPSQFLTARQTAIALGYGHVEGFRRAAREGGWLCGRMRTVSGALIPGWPGNVDGWFKPDVGNLLTDLHLSAKL